MMQDGFVKILITLSICFRTRGDGNCLYRACSKLLCGKDDLCGVLRDLTSIELFNNQQFYAFHPYVKEKLNLFSCENTAFSATVSDGALSDGYDRKNASTRTIVVEREALRNAVDGTFSSQICMFALSSVIGMNIVTVYPEKVGEETKYSKFLNGTIHPRAAHGIFASKVVQDIQLILMWTCDGIATLPGLDVSFQPNHFVPLVKSVKPIPSAKSKVLKMQQRKITDVFEGVRKEEVVFKGMIFKLMYGCLKF